MVITSLQNDKIKYLVKLQDAKFRKKEEKFLVEGDHLIEEAKLANLLLESYSLVEDGFSIVVTEEVMKKISQTDSRAKIVGVCKMPEALNVSNKVLLLDHISDPTNLGTILRSASSFGFNTVFASNDTVDFYNDKVVRGSQGAIFKLCLLKGDLLAFMDSLSKTHLIYGTNVRNGMDVSNVKHANKLALVLGNEANGVSKEVENKTKLNLYIKLENMESLNVSVAASILMYELNKK